MKRAKKHSPFRRAAFAHLLRYQGLAVPKYSCAPECLANERMRLKICGLRLRENEYAVRSKNTEVFGPGNCLSAAVGIELAVDAF